MKKFSLVCITLAFAISCSDETTIFKNLEDDISLETDQNVLDNSVSFDNSGVIDVIIEEDVLTGKSARLFSKRPEDELAGDYPLSVVAQVAPPNFNAGNIVTATDVAIDGDFAYVSYNTAGDVYFGGMDVINISDPNNPRVTSRLYYSNADVNAITHDDGFVYFVGGVDSERSALATSNSFVGRIMVSNGILNTAGGVNFGFQEGFNATDVKTTATSIIVSSGGDGFLTIYDKNTIEITNEAPFVDLRSFVLMDDKIAVLDASKGVSILDQDLAITSEIAISSDFGPFSKRTIDLSGNNIIVSEGSQGAGVYDYNNGSFLQHIPILINPDGVADEDIVTNAVSTNEDLLFMANGGAGLSLAKDQGNGNGMELVGLIELNGSINHVESKGDYLFAASGNQGLQIIKLNRPSESLMARCSMLPEYSGRANLNVNQDDDFAFSGTKALRSINVGGSLLLCGSWTVSNNININENGLFEMNGILSVGNNNRRRNITVNSGAVLRVEGNLNIFGNLNLNDGATIEFIGNNSVVNITGNVNRSGTTQVLGNFDDVNNKF